MTAKLTVKTIPITRMDCPTCIPLLEREVRRLKGVSEVQGNYMTKTLKVTYASNQVQLEEIEAAIERIGYRIAYKKYPGVLERLKGIFREAKDDLISPLTDVDFSRKVLQASKPVGVLFSSPTCPTCLVFKRGFKDIVRKLGGNADFYEMDIGSSEIWRKYDILSIPSVLIFRDGQLYERFEGFPRGEKIVLALGGKM